MGAQPNYRRMPGPGDFSPPDDPPEHDSTAIRITLESSPKFVEEAIGEETDWRSLAKAVIDRDAMEVLRLLDVAVQKSADWHIHKAEEAFDADPGNNRHNPDGEIAPWRQLERDYGEQIKRTPLPSGPMPLDMRSFANRLMRGLQP